VKAGESSRPGIVGFDVNIDVNPLLWKNIVVTAVKN
jgi:hypothetical protein